MKLRFFSSGSASSRAEEPSGLAWRGSASRSSASTRAVLPAPSAPSIEKVRITRGVAWSRASCPRAGRGALELPVSLLELREVVLPELERSPRSPRGRAQVPACAKLHAADLAGDGLGQVGELDAAAPACRARGGREGTEDVLRRRRSGAWPGRGRRRPWARARRTASGLGTTAASATAGCSMQRALQLERADAVVGALEHVVGAPDVGDVAVGVARSRRRRCGSSRRASRRRLLGVVR